MARRDAGSRLQGAAHENSSQVLVAAPGSALSRDTTQGSEKPSPGRWSLEPHRLAPPPTHLAHATNSYEHLPSAGPLLSTLTQNSLTAALNSGGAAGTQAGSLWSLSPSLKAPTQRAEVHHDQEQGPWVGILGPSSISTSHFLHDPW